ncbi:MAG: C39 family peptidase [Clostridiales bacterium]|jgi:uncharacterized protein YvpB|nr:C39 family peptidase [Clostridiales bacterium]
MNKFIACVIVLLLLTLGIVTYNLFLLKESIENAVAQSRTNVSEGAAATVDAFAGEAARRGIQATEDTFQVYVDGVFSAGFEDYAVALEYASRMERAEITHRDKTMPLWNNYPPYHVITKGNEYREFNTFAEAVVFAKNTPRSFIYYFKDNAMLWSNVNELPAAHKIEGVPLVLQRPELPNGCEVTSLTMLLNYNGVMADKLELAARIKMDPTPREWKDGRMYWGDPSVGFVGKLLDRDKEGFGVYHGPVFDLLAEFYPNSALDLTGCEFEDLLYFLAAGRPVWVITNVTGAELPDSEFVTWTAPTGEIRATYSEHSVLLTGFDESFVYYNDPLGESNAAEREDFKAAWTQMGKQAVALSH